VPHKDQCHRKCEKPNALMRNDPFNEPFENQWRKKGKKTAGNDTQETEDVPLQNGANLSQ
jgi:hypothetical protein